MRTARPFLVVVLAVVGCSGSSKPYKTALAGARVVFTPEHDPKAGLLSGPEAHGETDADGHYSLATVFQDKGATQGRNRVMISTRKQVRPPNDPDGPVKEVAPEKVPSKYFTEQAPLYFDVPAGGTSSANFELTRK
jgi:hypothetical protein